jgi:hypothetical protein
MRNGGLQMYLFRARVVTPGGQAGVDRILAALRTWPAEVSVLGTTDANGNIGAVIFDFEFEAKDEEARRAVVAMLSGITNASLDSLQAIK